MQIVLLHHPPDLVLAHIAQMLGKQPSVPAAVASRRGLIERFQDALFGNRSVKVYLRRFSAERALSLRPAIFSRANRRSTCLPAPVGSPSLRRSLCRLVHCKPKESHWPVRPYAVRFWNSHPTQKNLVLLSRKPDFGSRSTLGYMTRSGVFGDA